MNTQRTLQSVGASRAPREAGGDAGDASAWVQSLREQDYDPWLDGAGHCWIRHHRGCRIRFPSCDLDTLDSRDRRTLFFRQWAWAISHWHRPAGDEAPNSYLYVCGLRNYEIGRLSANNRSKVRRGLRRNEVRRISESELIRTGYECYADTRIRNELSPASRSSFEQSWTGHGAARHRLIWGAFARGELVGFLAAQVYQPWAEIFVLATRTAHLRSYTSYALCYTALQDLKAAADGLDSVCFGCSSLQLHSHSASLHRYKTGLGFAPIPVVRVLEVHPWARLFTTSPARGAIRLAGRMLPRSLVLRKANGLMEYLLKGNLPPVVDEYNPPLSLLEAEVEPAKK